MGLFDKLATMLKVRKEQVNILVIGLNNSGKSTIVNHFKEADERSSIVVPTVGFSVEKFQSEWPEGPEKILKTNIENYSFQIKESSSQLLTCQAQEDTGTCGSTISSPAKE